MEGGTRKTVENRKDTFIFFNSLMKFFRRSIEIFSRVVSHTILFNSCDSNFTLVSPLPPETSMALLMKSRKGS